MRNWLGQEIIPGTVVYRGARDGNSSSYKIGVVQSVKDKTARVDWKFEAGYRYRRNPGGHEYLEDVPKRMTSSGSPAVSSLIRIDESAVDLAEQLAVMADRWQADEVQIEDYKALLQSLPGI